MANKSKMIEKNSWSVKFPSSVFFNLFALSIFFAIVMLLHQVLKQPQINNESVATETNAANIVVNDEEINSKEIKPEQKVQDIDKLEASQTVQPVDSNNEVASVNTEVLDIKKEAKARPEKRKHAKAKKLVKRSRARSVVGEKEVLVEELDNEAARLKYMEQIYSQVQIDEKKEFVSSTSSTYENIDMHESDLSAVNNRNDLDGEGVRQQYLEENERLSKGIAFEYSE
ncbi:MAG: hypothetical protein COS89_04295 [Deltaproteobacteria bacterium CG07_land_8_20_14_0_80_38_7]|nr:MAG: hypothetical protein COS89_04295 [Deltaproteobacteria bacterium CG07_land_8_20_14_0_80_38_7]